MSTSVSSSVSSSPSSVTSAKNSAKKHKFNDIEKSIEKIRKAQKLIPFAYDQAHVMDVSWVMTINNKDFKFNKKTFSQFMKLLDAQTAELKQQIKKYGKSTKNTIKYPSMYNSHLVDFLLASKLGPAITGEYKVDGNSIKPILKTLYEVMFTGSNDVEGVQTFLLSLHRTVPGTNVANPYYRLFVSTTMSSILSLYTNYNGNGTFKPAGATTTKNSIPDGMREDETLKSLIIRSIDIDYNKLVDKIDMENSLSEAARLKASLNAARNIAIGNLNDKYSSASTEIDKGRYKLFNPNEYDTLTGNKLLEGFKAQGEDRLAFLSPSNRQEVMNSPLFNRNANEAVKKYIKDFATPEHEEVANLFLGDRNLGLYTPIVNDVILNKEEELGATSPLRSPILRVMLYQNIVLKFSSEYKKKFKNQETERKREQIAQKLKSA